MADFQIAETARTSQTAKVALVQQLPLPPCSLATPTKGSVPQATNAIEQGTDATTILTAMTSRMKQTAQPPLPLRLPQ